jgi:hypothetical protein
MAWHVFVGNSAKLCTAPWANAQSFVLHHGQKRKYLYCIMGKCTKLCTAPWAAAQSFVLHHGQKRKALYCTMGKCTNICTAAQMFVLHHGQMLLQLGLFPPQDHALFFIYAPYLQYASGNIS